MEVVNYYLTTLTQAFMKLGPLVLFFIGGYFVFMKLPFLFLKKNLMEQKKVLNKQSEDLAKMTEKKLGKIEVLSHEEILGFGPNDTFTKAELKKRYYDKLKENHPDRVASMGEDFKKLAEKNTKEINKAYDKLKNRAA